MPTINYPFTTDSDYVKTSDLEITGGKCQGKLKDLPGELFNQDFSADTGFTYDNTKAEFSGGQVQQKDLIPANAMSGANYDSSIDLQAWSGGVVTGAAVGGASVSGGKLDLTGGTTKNVVYDADLNADSQQTGCIRFKWTPNYSGAPSGVNRLITIQLSAASVNNRIWIYHTSTLLFWQIFDSAGATIVSQAETFSPTAGTEYEIELNWDATAGETRLFIDGVQLSTTNTGTGTRSATIGMLRIGQDNSDFYFDDFIYFSTVQHTANYTPGYTVPTYQYEESVVDLPQFSYTGLGAIQAFSGFTPTELNAPRWVVNGLYWDGATWSVSAYTWITANTAADVLANIATLPASDTLDISIVFNDGSVQMSVSNLSTEYTGQEYPQESDAQNVYPNTDFRTDKINSISGLLSANAQLILVSDSIKKWYTGGAWVASNGLYTESNTLAELTDLIMEDFTDISVDAYFIVVFGGDGTTQEYADLVTLDFSFAGDSPTITTATIWGYLYDTAGNVQVDKIVSAKVMSQQEFSDGAILDIAEYSGVTDSTGYWEVVVAYDLTRYRPAIIEFNINEIVSRKKMLFKSDMKYTELESA